MSSSRTSGPAPWRPWAWATKRLQRANPRLIYASVTGFGRTGPAGGRPGFDQIAQGYSGLMSVTGTAESGPVRVGVAIGDQTAGMWCAIGVLAAIAERHASGRGRRVETSLLAGLVGLMSVQAQRYLSLGEVPALAGNTHPVISPYGVFETADGPLNIAPATAEMWKRLCDVLELQQLVDDPRYATNAARIERRLELKALIEARLKERSRHEWTQRLLAADIPAGPINNLADVFADEQVRPLAARGGGAARRARRDPAGGQPDLVRRPPGQSRSAVHRRSWGNTRSKCCGNSATRRRTSRRWLAAAASIVQHAQGRASA